MADSKKMECIRQGLVQTGKLLIEQCVTNCDENTKRKCLDFSLRLVPKNYSSRLGCYSEHSHHIEISGINHECRYSVLITFIHELSHHIETVKSKHTGHQKSFYDIHIALLKKAIDLGILSMEDIERSTGGYARNKNKLARLMNNYVPDKSHSVGEYIDTTFFDYMSEEGIPTSKYICVKGEMFPNTFLSDNGFVYDEENEVWRKVVNTMREFDDCSGKLQESGHMPIKLDGKLFYSKSIRIVLRKNTYPHKDIIKQLGYTYSSSEWSKRVAIKEINQEIKKLKCIRLDGVEISYQL